MGSYGGCILYESISKLRNAHANIYEYSVEGVIRSRYIVKDTFTGILYKYPTRSELFEKFSL